MRATYGHGKTLSEIFFSQLDENSTTYVCLSGTNVKKAGSSYENLLRHIYSAHPNYTELIGDDVSLRQCKMEQFFIKSKRGHFVWMVQFSHNWPPAIFNGREESVSRQNST